jgi:hypothetical protein
MVEEIFARSRLAELQSEAVRVQRQKETARVLAAPRASVRHGRLGSRAALRGESFMQTLTSWPGV